MHLINNESNKFATELNIETKTNEELPYTQQAKNLKEKAKQEGLKKIQENWESKPLHGQYPKRSQQADVGKDKTR